eukprot:1184523-Prorocentrum_minimum.AAC.1
MSACRRKGGTPPAKLKQSAPSVSSPDTCLLPSPGTVSNPAPLKVRSVETTASIAPAATSADASVSFLLHAVLR